MWYQSFIDLQVHGEVCDTLTVKSLSTTEIFQGCSWQHIIHHGHMV